MEPVQAEHFKIYMQWVGGDYIQETQINLPERMGEGINLCKSAGGPSFSLIYMVQEVLVLVLYTWCRRS